MTEDNKFQEYLDKADKLEKMDFSKKEDFDYKEYFTAIKSISDENNNIKGQEAENVINEYAPKYFSLDTAKSIENKKNAYLNYIRKYDPNTDTVKNMKIHDADMVFAVSNYILNSYIKYLNEVNFIFKLSGEEMKFLDRILTKTIMYNGDDVFNYVKLYNEFWKPAFDKYLEDKSLGEYSHNMNIQMILILHHLIKGYTVKGSGNDFMYFRNILYQIAETNKLFNAYNVGVERLKENSKTWGAAMDAVVAPQDPENKIENDPSTVENIKTLSVEEVTKATE